MNQDDKALKLVMLPGKCRPDGPESELYQRVYALWKTTWVSVFTEVGSPQAWNADAFFRCEQIPVIMSGGEVAAFYVASVYSLQDSVLGEHSYFSIFPSAAKEYLRKQGVRSAMSYEFLTVPARWRKGELGVSLAGVLVELGLKVRDELECDVGVGVARIQNKVHELAHDVGGFTLEKEARRGNLVCEIVGFLPSGDKPSAKPGVHRIAEDLWQGRVYINKYGFKVEQETKRPKAA